MNKLEFTDGHIEQIIDYEMLENNGIFLTTNSGTYRCVPYYYGNMKLGYKCRSYQWQRFDADLFEFLNTDIVKEAHIYKTLISS